ncbi:MAG: peptidylprolyl isomerase [Gemmatimonadota bacterium]
MTPSHLLALVAGALALLAPDAAAQARARASGHTASASTVDTLARLMAIEDARDFQPALLGAALRSRRVLVRRTAAMTAGRIGDRRAAPLLVRALADADTGVQANALFALGLLRDTSAISAIAARVAHGGGKSAIVEGVTALARIGGSEVARLFGELLEAEPSAQWGEMQRELALQAWRLGAEAPVGALRRLAASPDVEFRWRAIYALARLRAAPAGPEFLRAADDADIRVRSFAVRGLSKAVSDAAQLPRDAVLAVLRRRLADPDAGVRITAMQVAATHGAGVMPADAVLPLLRDPMPNVRVQAAATLGAIGSPEAAAALREVLRRGDRFGVEREALLGLARSDRAGFAAHEGAWASSEDWRRRAAVAQGWMIAKLPEFAARFLDDPDGRVVATALQGLAEQQHATDPMLVAGARRLLTHADAVVRATAATILARAADTGDVAPLGAAYRRALADSFPDAALAALEALKAIAAASDSTRALVEREFAANASRPEDYLLRRWANEQWPALAARWGPTWPAATGRSLEDYRTLVRRYVVGPAAARRPRVVIETEDAGTVRVELFGDEAPLTVANFLGLVGRHFFDGNRWHRVVPNFVVQDGDPRGDGNGGPGGAIRDELNRRRYDTGVLGMALSGPDTGASQWFITLSPQPHLDGTYTVFGRVLGEPLALWSITQGDRIRTIRRQES